MGDQILNCLEGGLMEEAMSILQKLENPCEWTDTSGLTLLHYSVKYFNVEIMQYLIEKELNIDAKDNSGTTPLMLAVNKSNVKAVEILLKSNADIYATDCEHKNSLEIALRRRFRSIFFSPKVDSHVILDMLFDKVNDDFSKGKLTHWLLNTTDFSRLGVVAFGNADLTRFLINNGYAIDFCIKNWHYTALHCAIMYGRYENAKILMMHGAKVIPTSFNGHTPLYYYAFNIEEVDENSEILKSLLKRSNTLSIASFNGYTEVEWLLQNGKKKTVKIILESDIDVNAYFKKGRFLLYFLIRNTNIDVLDLLDELNIEFDANERGDNGNTSLVYATYSGYPRAVEFLLQHGANANEISLRFKGFSTAVLPIVGIKRDLSKVIELLLQYGADCQAFFHVKSNFVKSNPLYTNIMIAHCAMLGALEPASLSDLSRSGIESNPILKTHFDLCTKQIEEMKQFKVYGTVTLFKFLTEREEKIVAYARNPELILALSNAIKNLTQFESYYVNSLQKRISRGLNEVKLQEEIALIIEELTGLCTNVHHSLVYKIMSYLNREDLRRLRRLKTFSEMGDSV